MNFAYEWLHIPTGATGTRTIQAANQLRFLQMLDRWNVLGGNVWKYTATI
jgi:hypothetical protein